MSNDISVIEFYASPDISNKLDISESTLRKYCQILEKSGWRFTKNERNARVFNEQDLDLLKLFLKLKEEAGMSLDNSSDMAVRYFQANDTLTHQESASITNALAHKQQNNLLQEVRHTKEYIEDYFDKRLKQNEEQIVEKVTEQVSEKFFEANDIVIEKFNQVADENDTLKKREKEYELEIERLKKENEALQKRVQELENQSFFKRFFKQK